MRKIIHCDADCFYASVEMRDDPSLRGRPIAVGGRSTRRGVISTCNYEARAFGVRSAMASAQATKLCPDLIILPSRMEAYRDVSKAMREIFLDYTDVIEPLSLDEAYLDVSDSELCNGSATLMANELRARVEKELGITVSVGVAANKFLAKVASDWQKPNGIFVVKPESANEFIAQLPVGKIPGVGKVTDLKMRTLGLRTCKDLQVAGPKFLCEHFGRFGQRLYEISEGIDDREVKPDRIRKSLSVERTFAVDLAGEQACEAQLPGLLQELARRLRKVDSNYRVAKTFVKVKFKDFVSTTLERKNPECSVSQYKEMMLAALERRSGMPIRLLGLGVRFDHVERRSTELQLNLFD